MKNTTYILLKNNIILHRCKVIKVTEFVGQNSFHWLTFENLRIFYNIHNFLAILINPN